MADLTVKGVGNTDWTFLREGTTQKKTDTGFGEVLIKSIAAVNDRANKADSLVEGLVEGRHANIHETMIAMEEANISFRLLTRVQNKVVSAYQDIMRLQV